MLPNTDWWHRFQPIFEGFCSPEALFGCKRAIQHLEDSTEVTSWKFIFGAEQFRT